MVSCVAIGRASALQGNRIFIEQGPFFMADHGQHAADIPQMDYAEHEGTYHGFVRFAEIATIDRPNKAAVTHMVLIPPRVAISRPPMPGPTM